ncbi:hypothetical protein EBN03_00745 [Nocardia stercoris]|uniref:Uncharacterized protein n=2 Tax=Nocardia stercoris TaxID=2483361 RepID=A0A3M2LBK9_9NOCA|nr:hypothetical protein EBN03_00745 [Nocardia stercoris]
MPDRDDLPAWIRLLALVAVLAALAAAVTGATRASTVRAGIEQLGHHTAPQTAATEDLSFALADMDARVADTLLAGSDPELAQAKTDAQKMYGWRRNQADSDLLQAMSVATDDEQYAIRDLLDRITKYEALASNVMQLNDIEHNPAGRPSGAVLDRYNQASGMLTGILTDAHGLTTANVGVVDRAYDRTESAATWMRVWLIVFGGLALAALIALQILLVVRTRRLVNPALVVATLLLVAVTGTGFAAATSAAHQLTLAQRQAFTSMLDVQRARAVGYDANADESRYLLNLDRGGPYEQAFLTKSQQLADVGARSGPAYSPALNTALDAHRRTGAIGFTGLLADRLRGAAFPDEAFTLNLALNTFRSYQRDDQVLRHTTDLRDAVAFKTDTDSLHPDGDFQDFDSKLSLVLLNERLHFERATAAGADALAGWTFALPYGALAAVAVLVLLGIRPRLAEFR